jgi:DNA polymerase-1
MARLLAVDGHSLAHRAWHAIRGSEDEVDNFVTGGFVSMLATAWTYGPFDGLVIAFDHPDNQRKQDFPEYKANRVDDYDLRPHIDDLQAHLRDCGFLVVVEPGLEGDDVLAAIADACLERSWQCLVLSSDQDLTALVCDDIHLLRPRGTMSDLRLYDPATVRASYGVDPEQYTDLAALRGDPSDGLVGVNGVGPKTAARLLRDHGSLAGIYGNLSILPPKIEAALRQGREIAERNRLLMSPLAGLQVDIDDVVTAGIDIGRVERALTTLGLGFAAGRLRFAIERPAPPPMAPAPHQAPDEMPVPVPANVLARREDATVIDRGEQAALF